MSLSIVIVNYRSWSFLENCLDGLLADPESGHWQIIVVDNHSADGRLASFTARFERVEFFEAEWNGGFAFGCNLGVAAARGEHLLFLNPDVIPVPGQVERLTTIKRNHPDVSILTARQVNGRNQLQKSWDVFPDHVLYLKSVKSALRKLMPRRFPNPRKDSPGLVFADWVTGAVLLIDRADLEALGGWREDYWLYAEDCDLCFRAAALGMKSASTPDVTFTHLHGGASRRNREITIRTKTEAIVSRHLFNQLNRRGIHRIFNHLVILIAAVPELLVWSLLDLLTLRRIGTLSVRSGMLRHLLAHYGRVLGTGDWRSAMLGSG